MIIELNKTIQLPRPGGSGIHDNFTVVEKNEKMSGLVQCASPYLLPSEFIDGSMSPKDLRGYEKKFLSPKRDGSEAAIDYASFTQSDEDIGVRIRSTNVEKALRSVSPIIRFTGESILERLSFVDAFYHFMDNVRMSREYTESSTIDYKIEIGHIGKGKKNSFALFGNFQEVDLRRASDPPTLNYPLD